MEKTTEKRIAIRIFPALHPDDETVAEAVIGDESGHLLTHLPAQPFPTLLERLEAMEYWQPGIRNHLLFLIPSEFISLITLTLPTGQMKFLDRLVPGLMEEYLAQDVEEMHFTILHRGNDHRAHIAAIEQKKLHSFAEMLPDQVNIGSILPDFFCVPFHPLSWNFWLEGDRMLCRLEARYGLALDLNAASLTLQLLQSQIDASLLTLPESFNLYFPAQDKARAAVIMQALQEQWDRVPIQLHPQEEASSAPTEWMLQTLQNSKTAEHTDRGLLATLSLHFSSVQQFSRLGLATMFLLLLIIALDTIITAGTAGFLTLDRYRLESNNQEMLSAIYGERADRIHIDDLIRRYQGNGGNTGFIPLFKHIMSFFPVDKVPTLSQLSYNTNGELLLGFSVDDIGQANHYKNALERAGVDAEISASTDTLTGQTNVQLRIYDNRKRY